MLTITGASWRMISQNHEDSLRKLLEKDVELQTTTISSTLGEIATRMSELANSRLVASALIDSSGKETYLAPYLRGIQRINGIPVDLLLVDFQGREIASNGGGSFSEQELSWLREKLPAGQPASRVTRGEKGEEMLAVEPIAFARSNSVEGAALYRIKLDEIPLQKGARLVHGKNAEQLLDSPKSMAAAVNVPPIYKHLYFAVAVSHGPDTWSADRQPLQVFFVLIGAMVVMVILLGVHFGKKLTRDLGALELFARGVGEKGFGTSRAESSDSLEVASLSQSINSMLDHLGKSSEELRQSNEELVEKNRLLADQKVEVERKNREIEDAKRTLEEKAEQLALTSKYKSEFLSSMSHELRTPLNSLLILAQLLAENAEHNMSEEQIEYAKIIQGAGKDLLALINDILDLSKIESGTVTLELQDISLASIGAQVERTFRHVAQSRSLGFGVELAPGLPPSLYTDSLRLQQVLKNLLSNAFKFTEKGQVSLRIAPVESGWSADHDGLNRAQTVIGFFVTDTGIGVPADKQKIIFEAFQQADTGTARKYGGTGLGLSISREIARLLGGEMRLVESVPGKGSTFVLYHPLRAPEAARPAPAAQEAPQEAPQESMPQEISHQPTADDARFAASLVGKKVLVVDDDMRNIFALTAALERRKMAVLSAENGRAAIEELVQNPDVDIVLMDIMMPEMDGYETMRQIRQMKQFKSLPMIALTAKAMKGDREKCIEAGASGYISKPVDTDELLSLLRAWL